MKNYLWNMFANIKNGHLAKQSFIYHPRKKICENFLKILWNEGFILGYKIDSNNKDVLKIFLKYNKNRPAINSIKQIWKIDSSKSFIILSTNQGLKSIIDCKKLHIGGEPIISIN